MKKYYLIYLFFAIALFCYGKNKTLVSERVFLAPTNTYYSKNDTVEIIGQLLSTEYTDFYPYSRYLYIELADKTNKLITRQKVKCEQNGYFHTIIPLEDNVKDGVYYLRGYTQFMRNRNNAFYPMTPLFVGVRPAIFTDNHQIKVMFFPEGGHLVGGVTQNVGIYLCNDINQPIQSKFWILKNDTDTIANGQTTKSGLATFGFIPQSGASYTLQTNQSKQIFQVPQIESTPTIQAIIHKNRLVCNVLSNNQTNHDNKHIFIYHSDFGLKEMTVINGTAIADLTGCTPGILSIWLTDDKHLPLAQRVLWVTNEKSNIQIELKTTYQKGENLTLELRDTIQGSQVFVRIVPNWDTKSVHAFDRLTFANELTAPIPFPTNYYEENKSEARHDIATWLLSANQTMLGNDFLQKDTVTYPYPIEAGLNLTGVILQDNKPVVNTNVQLLNTHTQDISMTTTDNHGHFEAQLNDYQDGTRFYLQAYNKNGKPDKFLYKLDEYEYPPIVNMATYHAFASETNINDLITYHSRLDSAKTYNLDEVVVVRHVVNQKQYNWARTRNQFNYYDHNFLKSRPNIYTIKDAILYSGKIIINNYDNNIYWKSPKYEGLGGGSSLNTHLNGKAEEIRKSLQIENNVHSTIAIVIDGFKIDHDISDILNMPTTDVESIELVLPTDPRSYWHNAQQGFFDIKTRTVMKKEKISSNGIIIRPIGLSIPQKAYKCKLPMEEGKYKVLIDVVSPNRQVQSFVKEIEVKK